MAYNSRAFHMLAILLLVVAGVFAYDAAVKGLWANLVLGIVGFLALVLLIRATYGLRPAKGTEPLQIAPDLPGDLRILLDETPIPLVRYSEGQGLRALNRAARSLFHTDDVILFGAEVLTPAMIEPSTDSRAILALFGRQYSVSVSEIDSADGRARLATLTDVQVEMHKAEAAALRDTLQVLSHEIMNSLTPVSSLADIADSYLADEANVDIVSAREALGTLSNRAKNLTRFIEAYRSVARLPEPNFQTVDPNALITGLMAFFARSTPDDRVRFEVDIASDLPRLSLDEALIGQAIINVVTNAVEAVETLEGERLIVVRAAQSHQNVVISIADNGPGIPESIQPGLFSAFATTKPKGTGTGLNLARQIALAHGGNLQLLDTADNLTTFVFTFRAQS